TDLPSLGPYSVDGRFTAAERNFDLSNLFIVFGDSTLQGNLGYFEGEERPIIVGRLASHRPRLEDFYLAPEDEDQRPAGAPQTSDTDGQEPVLDPELLRLVDLDLSFDVTGFEWGDRGPGTGEFRLQLDDGRLVTTVRWDQPQGGYINARLNLESDGEVFDATLDADIDHMSYGPLRPLLEWEGGQGGVLSLDTRLSGSGT
ncbi:MAG: hypothetical protein IFK92_00875, partial [Acidobacteria bacterium]|nr:hypothetical protein [Candidatus Sulfomarinibacter kjeldsenii]